MSSPRLPAIAALCFVAGCLLVLIVDAGVARAVGVPLIFTGIALGVFAIATPGFLEEDRYSMPNRSSRLSSRRQRSRTRT